VKKYKKNLNYKLFIHPLFIINFGNECETGKGVNQIGNLHQSGTTWWSSHFDSI